MKAVASINARMGSTRLPGKVLMDIDGVPLLTRIIRRLAYSRRLEGIILATTQEPEDDVLVDWAEANRIPYHRGSVTDVLRRTVEAHRAMHSDIVVRVCGDTPLIDAEMVDVGIDIVASGEVDIAMATARRKFPHGTTAHVCKFSDLAYLDETLTDPVAREHVTLALYENGGYRVHEYQGRPEWKCEGQRLQVDYREDLEVVRLIQGRFRGDDFGIGEIVDVLNREPWIREINADCKEKAVR